MYTYIREKRKRKYDCVLFCRRERDPGFEIDTPVTILLLFVRRYDVFLFVYTYACNMRENSYQSVTGETIGSFGSERLKIVPPLKKHTRNIWF